jgi:hypothetical protein
MKSAVRQRILPALHVDRRVDADARMVEEWLGIDRITDTSKDPMPLPFAGLRTR